MINIIVVQSLIMAVQGQQALNMTYTGLNCLDCINAGHNHCLLQSQQGVCCPRGDARCKERSLSGNYPGRLCVEDVGYDKQVAALTCPLADRCPGGGTEQEISLDTLGQRTGFSDSWGWFQYIYGSVCRYRVNTVRSDANLLIKVGKVEGTSVL